MRTNGWRDFALCAEVGWSLFEVPDTDDPGVAIAAARVNYTQAREVCALCPVREECLRDILAYEGDSQPQDRYGFYAGLTPVERHTQHRKSDGRK